MTGELTGSKVFLRELTLDDWTDVHSYATLPEASRYQPWGPNTVTDSFEFVQTIIKDATRIPRTRFVFAVIHLPQQKLVGAGEVNIRSLSNQEGEISYIIHPDYWGQGLASETARLLLQYGFHSLRLHRIFGTCDPRNIASARVLEKVGMVEEGHLRQNLRIGDDWRDSLLFGVLTHEWNDSL
ncbi:GNAT family N-acetyltransferase [Sporosarcina cyprini]|uniref:GNAT family N-acetyltransferase n=1 Tax=Sporosarcina cyprini TaxID=2910523 RepID=UPI001EDE94E3|nr:GNAT family protein [Sporosarcina cyprini]MCG3087481.1 GNAT family N-acetyltransferase [Sporosarcina cyprini]